MLCWFKRLRSYFERHFSGHMKVLWTGDLNVAPEPVDLHNPQDNLSRVCFEERVRKAFQETMACGFVDVFRKHHPEPDQYTFFDYRTVNAVKRKMGWRIDHMLASPPLARRSTDAFIDLAPRLQPSPSDHTFLVTEYR